MEVGRGERIDEKREKRTLANFKLCSYSSLFNIILQTSLSSSVTTSSKIA